MLSFLPFVKYSLGSVLRNGKRSVYALIGIVIALSLISGSWIAIDSSGIGLLRSAVSGVPVDYLGSVSPSVSDYSEYLNGTTSTVETIESVDDIEAAMPLLSIRGAYYMNSTGGTFLDSIGRTFNGSLAFVPSGSQHLLNSFKIVGSLPDPGSSAIPKSVAESLDLNVGDDITCVFEFALYRYNKNGTVEVNRTYFNITSEISSIWTQPGFEKPNQDALGPPIVNKEEDDIGLGLSKNPVVFNLDEFKQMGINYSARSPLYSLSLNYFIWANRGEVVRLANLESSVDQLGVIRSQLARELYPSGISVSDSNLVGTLVSLRTDLGSEEPMLLALSVPVLALGIYLSMVGVDLGITDRRREAGILKSRGASNSQVLSSLVVEALALGTIAGIAGLLLGVFVSRFLLGAVASLGGDALTHITDFLVSPSTVILSVLLGVGLMVFSSYGPFKRISRTDVAQALHHYSASATRIEYSASTDIMLLSLSFWSVIAIFLGVDWPSQQRLPWIVESVASVLFIFGVQMLPLLPFLMSLSLVRLLTRGSRRIYSKFTWIVKSWTKEVHYLVDRNIVRNPRRASNLCMIISLALAFGLFISITMESTMNYEREKVRFEVGSDVKLDIAPTVAADKSLLNDSRLGGLDAVPGVEHAVTYSRFDMTLDISGDYSSRACVVFNSSDYRDTVNPSDFYFVGGGSELLGELVDSNGILLTSDFADRTGVRLGDTLPAIIQSYARYNRISVTVLGFVKGLPGFVGVDAFVDRSTISVISDENLTGLYDSSGAFIRIASGADPYEVADAAAFMYESSNLTSTPVFLKDRLNALKSEPTFASLAIFLYMEYALSIVIMTIGVGLLIFVSVHDRERELACIMARGASGRQLRKMLMGESMSLMILGLLVGTTIGILTAYLFNSLSGEELYAAVERPMMFTGVSISLLLSSIIALLAASLVATAQAGKIKLAEVLRIRGG